jgi:hypothetical protein
MVIVMLDDCSPPDTAEIVALDGSSGQPAWRELVDEYEYDASQRHGLIELSTLDDPGRRYVDPRSGREITELTPILGEWDFILGKHARRGRHIRLAALPARRTRPALAGAGHVPTGRGRRGHRDPRGLAKRVRPSPWLCGLVTLRRTTSPRQRPTWPVRRRPRLMTDKR